MKNKISTKTKSALPNKNHVLRVLVSSALLVVVIFLSGRFQNSAEAAPDSVLYFEPASISVSEGQSFNLEAVINPGLNEISAVEMHVTFDASKFNLLGIHNNSQAFPQVLQLAQIDNTNGTASITLGVPLSNPPNPVTATTIVATFEFQVLAGAQGISNVSFVEGTQAAAFNESSNVLTSMNPSQVTAGKTYGNMDFANLVADWLQTKTSPADVDGDGTVNAKDLGIMMSNWEQ